MLIKFVGEEKGKKKKRHLAALTFGDVHVRN